MEEKKTEELDETEMVPINERKETIQFPWGIAIFIGILMVLIIACLIAIILIEH